ncbi:hypothetical protein Q7P37_005423 [Cladosporium fusiforme]
MHFLKASMLATLAATPSALSAVLSRQSGSTCETTDGSPELSDVQELIEAMKTNSDSCKNRNIGGSVCSTVADRFTAAIGVCGGLLESTPCATVAGWAEQLVDECASDTHVGGEIDTGEDYRVIVFHSDDS